MPRRHCSSAEVVLSWMKLVDELRRTQCHTRVFVAWLLVSAALWLVSPCAPLVFSLIYAVVVYASLVSKNVLPADPGPDYVPFTNIPRRYNVTLRFDSESSHPVPVPVPVCLAKCFSRTTPAR